MSGCIQKGRGQPRPFLFEAWNAVRVHCLATDPPEQTLRREIPEPVSHIQYIGYIQYIQYVLYILYIL